MTGSGTDTGRVVLGVGPVHATLILQGTDSGPDYTHGVNSPPMTTGPVVVSAVSMDSDRTTSTSD